jgi:AraC family transcriptional regulator
VEDMDLLKNMNDALTYIEENLENDLDMAQVAKIARCSEFHFKKNVFLFSRDYICSR